MHAQVISEPQKCIEYLVTNQPRKEKRERQKLEKELQRAREALQAANQQIFVDTEEGNPLLAFLLPRVNLFLAAAKIALSKVFYKSVRSLIAKIRGLDAWRAASEENRKDIFCKVWMLDQLGMAKAIHGNIAKYLPLDSIYAGSATSRCGALIDKTIRREGDRVRIARTRDSETVKWIFESSLLE